MTRIIVEFDFRFEHKTGKTNQVVDMLSQKSKHTALCMLTHIHLSKIDGSMRNITREHLYKDSSAKAVVDLAKVGKTRQFWVEEC